MQNRRRMVGGVSRPTGAAVDLKPPLFTVCISNPSAFSGDGSMIVLELADKEAALRAARIVARETGRCVIVQSAKAGIIQIIPAASTH